MHNNKIEIKAALSKASGIPQSEIEFTNMFDTSDELFVEYKHPSIVKMGDEDFRRLTIDLQQTNDDLANVTAKDTGN